MKTANIKFKAKRLDNGEWIEGDLIHKETYVCIGYLSSEIPNITRVQKVDTSTVCQFTGLKDCEGSEIWEGDVLLNTNSGSQYTVMYSDYGGAFFIRKKGTVNDDMYLFELSDVDKCIAFLEVIGNKFDKEK
jgi:uncharacterized phage protein (TIGR01671 family)